MNKHISSQEYFKKVMENQKAKRWCEKHVTSYWGVNPETGEYYEHCANGFKLNEACIARED